MNVPSVVWLALIGLTLISVGLFEGGMLGPALSVVIVLIAAVKSRMVILHFMEAKHVSGRWRFLYELWNFSAAATIIIGYVLGVRAGGA